MYLKEIKAHGFKSFADKINIELGPGLTGIVGPNGSGKSNVVDAIRWVLGEQSVKSLRGDGTMADVIFSGSKSRNAMNVASVTLIFDNTDKYLPLEFDEVSIKRMVYRDGTNEYFINNERVRLKDVTNILLDSGIAKESFNIISQGKIESIISDKPSDRRVIFEEAAGVLKYKRRKEEAIRKLDKTHDNMNRVNDIVSELEIQVEPLKEAKEKALKYTAIKEELEDIEIALITSDITNINRKYQEGKDKIDTLSKEIIEISTSNSKGEAENLELKNKLQTLENDIKAHQDKIIDMISLVERLNSQKSIILERKNYEADDSKVHRQITELKEESLKLENKINALENDVINLNSDLDKEKSEALVISNKINELKENKNILESKLTNSVREKNNLNVRIEHLKDSIENNSSLPLAVKSVLDNPKLRGIHNTIGNIIEVNKEYSIAISTSLGMNISNIIVDNEISAKEAINYLKNIGRATFFPLNIIKPKFVSEEDLNKIKNQNGFVGIASTLVSYDKKYENIIKNQLGHIVVVDNLETANTFSKLLNHRYRIVTLEGDVVNVGGSLTGGKVKVSKNTLNEKFELEEAENKLKKVINGIKEYENTLNQIYYDLKAEEDKLYIHNKESLLINEHLKNKQIEIQSVKDRLEKVNLDIRGNDNLLNERLSNEEEEVLEKYYSAIKAKEEVQNSLDRLVKEKSEINELLEEKELLIKKENASYNSKSNELKQLEIDVNRMDVKLDNLLNALNESYSLTYEKAYEKYTLAIPEDIARNKVSSLKRKLKEIGVVNLAAPEEYDRISQRYEFLLKQINDLSEAENTLLEIIKEMDQKMTLEFEQTFKVINEHFKETFKELFKGGNAGLKLTDPNNLLETGVDIVASPPGKKLSSISLLSGGEKSLTAISLLFAIIKSRTAPFCILDEVEAALDEVNVDTFGEYVSKLKEKSQFIIITHKKRTMEYVDVLYGVTMQESGVSKLVSVKLEEIDK